MIFVKVFNDLIDAMEYSNKHKNSEIVIKNRCKRIDYIVSWRK